MYDLLRQKTFSHTRGTGTLVLERTNRIVVASLSILDSLIYSHRERVSGRKREVIEYQSEVIRVTKETTITSPQYQPKSVPTTFHDLFEGKDYHGHPRGFRQWG
jgi:hypothetical protein